MAFTVTATLANNVFSLSLKVYVVTGGIEAGGNGAGSNASPPNASLTPAGSSSLILTGLYNESSSTGFTPSTSNTEDHDVATGGSTETCTSHYTGTVTAGTPVTAGASAPLGVNTAVSAYEILARGGVTPVIDSSSTGLATGTSPVTSTSFTPPNASVLVAVVVGAVSSAATPVITDTSGLGLTWTLRRQDQNTTNGQSVSIFTATMPGVGFDAVGPSSAGTTFTTSPGTWTHVNNGNGILVGITIFAGSTDTVTAVSYGGVSLSKIGYTSTGGAAGGISYWGRIGGLPTGSNTVSVTASDTNNHNTGSVSVSNAGSFGTLFSANSGGAGATSQAVTVNGTTTGGLIVTVACHGASGTWGLTGGTVQYSHNTSINSASDNTGGGTAVSTGGGANQTLTWTNSASDQWGVLAVEVLPPAAAAAQAPRPQLIPPGRQSPMAFRYALPYSPPAAAALPTPVTLADAAAGISEDGALAVSAAVPLAEAGGAVEAISVQVTEAGSDVGAAVESLTIAATVALPDVGAGVESNVIGVALADAAGAVDSLAVTVAAPLAEAGGAVDSPAIAAAVPLGDAGGAVDNPVIAATVPLAEKGAGVEALSVAAVLGLADVGAGVESQVSGQPVAFADVAGAADVVVAAAAVPLADVAGAVEAIAVAVTTTLADVGAAVETEVSGVPILLAEVAGSVDLLTTTAVLSLPDVAGAADTLSVAVALSLPDVGAATEANPRILVDAAAALDALSVVVSVPLSESAGAADRLVPNAAVAFSEAAGATDIVLVVTGVHPSGTVTWTARADRPRWLAGPELPRWSADAVSGRWSASPGTARWKTQPAPARWRSIMATFDPISSDSLEEVNVRWFSDLDGVTVDPTVSPLTVQMAFPVSSGDLLHPTHASTWYAATWLAGGTGKGFVAQCLVGPGGGVTTLTAGKYDVWSWVQGSPESPKKFAGTLTVY